MVVFYGISDSTTSIVLGEDNQRYLQCGSGYVGIVGAAGVGPMNTYTWASLSQSKLKMVDTSNRSSNETAVTARIYGGYVSGKEIKMFCSVEQSGYPKCWVATLAEPVTPCIEWTEVTMHYFGFDHQTLLNIQHCGCYDVYFYEKKFLIIRHDDMEQMICPFSAGAHQFNEHVKCVIINDNLFIFNENKMGKIENVEQRLSPKPCTLAEPTNIIELIQKVPHMNCAPFVIEETLFVVGGNEKSWEPFSEIYQFLPDKQKWECIGLSKVSRFGASAVVFTDTNNNQAVFIAGGFKDKDVPCSVIEELFIVTKSRGMKRTATEAELDDS